MDNEKMPATATSGVPPVAVISPVIRDPEGSSDPRREHHHEQPEKVQAFTLRIPRPNWQVTALILIAVIAGLQTIQLARLKDNVTAKASTATTTTAAPASSASTDSGLQSQVGGC